MVVRFIRGHWVHRGAPSGSTCSSRVSAYYGVHPGHRRVRPRSLSPLGWSSGSSVFIGVLPWGIPVQPRSMGSLGFALGVVGSLGTLGCALEVVMFTVVAGFIELTPEGGRGSPRSFMCAMGVVWFVSGH